MASLIFRIIIVSNLLFLGGWLGLKMAAPPGYASPLWPPAGMALSALLLGGKRLWPSIWLGSFATNVLVGLTIEEQLTSPVILSSSLIGLGSTLQAFAGIWLSQRFIHPSAPPLDNPKQVVTFFLLTGPLSCWIAPCIGVSGLFALDLLPPSELFTSWGNWWFGDSLGVLLVTPLIFCLLAKPRQLWRPRLLRVALPLLITLLALAIAFVFVFRSEQARMQLSFDSHAANIERLLREAMDNVLDSTQTLADIAMATGGLDRQAFSLVARGLLRRHPEIQALEWLPRVSASELPAFEQAVRAEGFPGFSVKERSGSGTLQPVSLRDEYFPILFIEPMAGNERAFGMDSGSVPSSRSSKQSARSNRKPSASEGVQLIQSTGQEVGVLVSQAVFVKSDTQGRPDDFRGFVSAVLLPARMMQSALHGIDSTQFGIGLRDSRPAQGTPELFTQPAHEPALRSYGLKAWQSQLVFADRSWQLDILPDTRFLAHNSSLLPWTTLTGGLCLASLLSILLLIMTGRTAQAEALARLRNSELERANAELNTIASDLKASELKLRTLIESQPECVKLLARDGSLLDMNAAGLAMIDAQSFEQIKGSRMDTLVLAPYRQAFKRTIAQVFAGQPATLEFEIQSLKGQHRWLNTQAVPMRNSAGEIIALLGLTRDVSERKRMESALRENEQKLSNILNNLSAYVYLKDTLGRYLYVNRAICELWQTSEAEILGYGDEKFFDAEAVAKIRAIDRRVLIDGETIRIEEPGLLQNTGKIGYFWTTKLPLYDEQGKIYALVGIATDISERKQQEDSLKLAARVFGEAHEGILITDAQANIVDVNPTFCEITGYTREEVIGKNPKLLQSGKHPPEFYSDMWQTLLQHRHWRGEVWNRKKNGELYAELLTMSALCDEHGQAINYIGLFSDITPIKQQQQMLELLAHYDALTQLPNRTLFADRLMQAIAHSKRDKALLAICFLDLDGFKQVNDQFGHDAGDTVLVEVSNRLHACLREEDTVSRHGGDEFALLLGDLHSIDECTQTLERLHQAIIEPYTLGEHSICIGVSSGITIYPLDDADPDTLLRHADHAMYQAKLAGKNRFHLFDANEDQLVIEHHRQLNDIALAFADEQFVLFYQPKVNLKTGLVTGAEALIRWQHPERGLLPPAEFLPIIASHALEIQFGNWVIEQAWRQLVAWHQQGLALEVSVNISAYHLLWPEFVDFLDGILALHPTIASHYLQLEILESTALDDLGAVNRIVKTCRDALGVSTALDDFGTGYSSLAHLRHLPVNAVKIDKGFVRDMLDDPDDYAIVESVIGLSHAFRHEVIAEGVETQEQGLMLLLLGCHLAQGYAIAKPMPAADLTDWTHQYQPFPLWQAYAMQNLSPQQIQVAIQRIDLKQWLHRVHLCLTGRQNGSTYWPTMETGHSHFGRWLKQAQQQGLYNDGWLRELGHQHAQLLQQGQTLMSQFWAGEAHAARAGFAELETLWRNLDEYLANYA